MATEPAVSVVIATRDRPELLRAAIAAALGQHYRGPIEVVVVFDQSEPDDSLARTTAGRTVRVVRNDRSPGLPGARNAGASAATGTLLAFCDDDDEWLPDKLTKQVAAMAAVGAATAVTGIIVDYRGREVVRIPTADDLRLGTLIRRRVFEAHPSSVVVERAAFFDGIGEVDEHIPGGYAEDYDWLLRAAAYGPVAVVPEPLVRVRWHQASFFARKWSTIIAALDYLVAKHPGFAAEPAALARIYGQKAFAYGGLGQRREARRWALRALRLSATEKRAYVALAMSARLLAPGAVLRLAHARGRGI